MAEAKKGGRVAGEPRSRKLTPQQEAFCRNYVSGPDRGNAAACYRAAYPKATRNAVVSGHRASDMMRRPEIIAFIGTLSAAVDRKIADEFEATVERIGRELSYVGFADPAQAIAAEGENAGAVLDIHEMPEKIRRAISSIKVRHELGAGDKVFEVTEVRFWPKVQALNTLAKWKRMLEERVAAGLPDDLADIPDDALEAELATLTMRAALFKARESSTKVMKERSREARAGVGDGGN